MACLGGCIGGGGQPIPSTEALVAQRTKGLYAAARQNKVRKVHLNPVVQDFFEYLKSLPEKKASDSASKLTDKKGKFE